jgi:hypothetical protein
MARRGRSIMGVTCFPDSLDSEARRARREAVLEVDGLESAGIVDTGDFLMRYVVMT